MIPRALTIAGSDSGGGAGIQQDLKTFQALGVWGMSALTAVTVQNTLGVSAFEEVSPDVVAAQIRAVASDIGVDAAKTGMLASAPIIEAVAAAVREAGITRLVVDPVFISKHGDALLREDSVEALRKKILPLALVATPNAQEAAALCGFEVLTRADQTRAAREIQSLGPRAVLVKGGHLKEDRAVDVLLVEGEVHEIDGPRLDTPHTHGTGCMLSAAIAAELAKGRSVLDAVTTAKRFVTEGIAHAFALGKGIGPVNASWRVDTDTFDR